MQKETTPTLKRVAELSGVDYGYARWVVSKRKTNSRKQRIVMKTYLALLEKEVKELSECIKEEAVTDFNLSQS